MAALYDHYSDDANPEHIIKRIRQHERLKVDLAIYWPALSNFAIFVIQLAVAVTTRYLILAAGAADAFMDLVCLLAMVAVAWMARKPGGRRYPVGRARTEPVELLMFCCLAMNIGLQLIVRRYANLFLSCGS